jgi:hypothetical protein
MTTTGAYFILIINIVVCYGATMRIIVKITFAKRITECSIKPIYKNSFEPFDNTNTDPDHEKHQSPEQTE